LGPTASGKTALAIELLKYFPFEIVSVDSVMIYRGMNIGSAKPKDEILKIAPHHLIDICDPADIYSAAQFCRDAKQLIDNILAQGKIPLLVGGTMMYFHSLQNGIAALPSADPITRQSITTEGDKLGWDVMHRRLTELDCSAARNIHPHDRQRIQRALEVCLMTGEKFSSLKNAIAKPHFQFCNIILAPLERSILHARIRTRFQDMLTEGLVEEVQALTMREDLHEELPAIRSVGYRQVWEFLQGQTTAEEMCEKGVIATRQLAKRQLTWLRRWSNATWFDSEAMDLPAAVVDFLRKALY
jgi:tRNA dimethylallyltransferase